MTKSKTSTTEQNPETVASTLSSIAAAIPSSSLSTDQRRQLRADNARVPDELIELIAHLAQQGNGSVLGTTFDATAASATLTQTSGTRTAISVGRQTLQRMEDDMLQQRATVADPAFAIYTSLRRLVKTKAGNALAPAYAQMKSIVKNRPRKSRQKTVESASTATPAPATSGGAVAAPAAAPTVTQAATPRVVASTTS